MNDRLFLHALASIPGVGAKTIRSLVGHYGSAEAAWAASPDSWELLPDIGPKTRDAFLTTKSAFDFEQAIERLDRDGVSLIGFLDDAFPELLKEIPDAPALLYVRGHPEAWQRKPLIALVGSRKFTPYGKQVAEELALGLSRAGFTIVSGLAFGIDSVAHEATFEAGGTTVAVLGSGIDDTTLSPQSHRELAHEIISSGGALLSELAPGTSATLGTFPARNRIMAGMTLGTLMVEAATDSGSLITARLALDYNREVFAVPGSIFSPASAGTHALIRAGAKLVTGLTDILEELAPHLIATTTKDDVEVLSQLSEPEQRLYQTLSYEPLHVDKIIEASRLETMSVSVFLTQLEMRGLIKNVGNMHYIRVKN